MISKKNELGIPLAERKFINPELRMKLFTEIYTMYEKKFGIKLVYAFLNSDPGIIADYAIIYSARNNSNTTDIIMFDIPPIHSDRSTPGYRYCKRMKKTKAFYDYGIDNMVIMEKDRFYEYITQILGFSRKKGDKAYWKDPANYEDLLKGLLDLSVMYNRKR